MIKFDIVQIEHQPLELSGTEPASFLAMPDSPILKFNSPVTYCLNISKVNQGVLVKGRVATVATGVCGGCLEPVEIEVANDEVCRYYEQVDTAELDISDDIREDLLINVPSNCLCRDTCAGLCQVCGTNLNHGKCDCKKKQSGNDAWSELDKLKL